MPKYTYYKYNSTRNFYIKHVRKTIFTDDVENKDNDNSTSIVNREKEERNKKEDKLIIKKTKQKNEWIETQDKKKEYVCPFCNVIVKNGLSCGGHVIKHRNEKKYKRILETAKEARNKNNV